MAAEYSLNRERRLLSDLHPAEYNPRKTLRPSDPEFRSIERSLREFGYVDPIIINADGTIIGGHQRHTVLQALGETEADVIVLDLSKRDEKALNIALNKIGGSWDMDLLREALADLNVQPDLDATVTGYDSAELAIILGDPHEEERDDPTITRMRFIFTLEQYTDLQEALALIGEKYKPKDMETFGNTNAIGNKIYMVVKEWAEQRKLLSR